MKKAIVILAVFCAFAATAGDRTAGEMLVEKVWGVNAETVIPEFTVSTAKAHHVASWDVALDNSTVALDSEEPPGPAFAGQTFIIVGYIYPAGTFAANDLNGGVNAEGGPEWPELQLGTWVCRGWVFIPTAMSSQVFDLGGNTLVTQGWENVDFVATRAVTGGTGDYSHARGEQVQTIVGFNASAGPNFVNEFHFQKEINFKK